MKNLFKYIGLTILLVFLFTGCDLLFGPSPVSPSERLSKFKIELNTDSRSTIYEHVHSGVSLYDQIKTSDWWEASSFSTANNPFTFSVTMSPESNGIVTGTGSVNYQSADYNIILTFKEIDTDVWYINSITLNDTRIIY